MNNKPIRVGIIGTGGWARYGHIPVLNALDSFEVVALAGRNTEKVQKQADELGIEFAFGSAKELIAHPDVELVVILTPTPEHGRLAAAAIAAGKDVYSEWPLSTNTVESEAVLTQAEAKGVRHVIGLQRRFSPTVRYMQHLIGEGYVGTIRAVNMTVGVDAFGPVMPDAVKWAVQDANFTTLLSIYGGHFMDLLFSTVGFPEKLTAVAKTQFPITTIEETGEQIPYTSANDVIAVGTLQNGALFSVQLEGGQAHRTGLHVELMGTDGALKLSNSRAFQNKEHHTLTGINGGADTFVPLPVPAHYSNLPVSHLDASAQEVAYLYEAYANDRVNETTTATNFSDAVRQHRIIDLISMAAADFRNTAA